jgi:hypothetical protein
MIIIKRIAALSGFTLRTVPALLSLFLYTAFLPNTGALQALELSGVLSLVDAPPDTCRIDFSKLDTPQCEIGLRPDTVNNPDVLFIRKFGQSPALYLLRAPYTTSTDSMTINLDRFSIKTPSNIDSLRQLFLPIAASVNPQCIQSGQCDTIGGGFFIKTSEGGVAFFRPSGRYVGGYDRFFFFWAYSSDGTFGGKTGITRSPERSRAACAASLRGNGYALYDLQGRRWGLADKKPPRNQPVIMNNGIAGQRIVTTRVAQRPK